MFDNACRYRQHCWLMKMFSIYVMHLSLTPYRKGNTHELI